MGNNVCKLFKVDFFCLIWDCKLHRSYLLDTLAMVCVQAKMSNQKFFYWFAGGGSFSRIKFLINTVVSKKIVIVICNLIFWQILSNNGKKCLGGICSRNWRNGIGYFCWCSQASRRKFYTNYHFISIEILFPVPVELFFSSTTHNLWVILPESSQFQLTVTLAGLHGTDPIKCSRNIIIVPDTSLDKVTEVIAFFNNADHA